MAPSTSASAMTDGCLAFGKRIAPRKSTSSTSPAEDRCCAPSNSAPVSFSSDPYQFWFETSRASDCLHCGTRISETNYQSRDFHERKISRSEKVLRRSVSNLQSPELRRKEPPGEQIGRRGPDGSAQPDLKSSCSCRCIRRAVRRPRTRFRCGLAEGVGFEPTLRFPVNTLSKRAP